MKRRDFIKAGSLMTIPVFLNGFTSKLFASVVPVIPLDYNDKILVIIQMDGGNDTLNTVIPTEHYSALSNLRSNILIPENKTLKINDKTSLHPSLVSIKELYDKGLVNIIRATGYPNQNRSHFRSTDIWMSGTGAEKYETTGWLGRYFALEHPDFPDDYPNNTIDFPFAVTIGSTASETCQGVKANYSVAVSDPNTLGELFEGEWDSVPQNCYGNELQYVRDMVRQSNIYSDIISNSYSKGNTLSTKYPSSNKLANDLKIVAKLISGGMKTKVYVLRIGGFDTHSGQIDPTDTTKGVHADLLRTLSDAIGAFQDDINLLGIDKRVIGMTFSEFGRQIRSNGSNGTDHGTAVDMFLFGSCIKPGLTGTNPQISPNEEKGNGVTMQNDFRSVYSSILKDWFELTQSNTESLLFGNFASIDLLNDCSSTGINYNLTSQHDFIISPNPAQNYIKLDFLSNNNFTEIKITDTKGKTYLAFPLQGYNSHNSVNINLSEFPAGIYFIKAGGKDRTITKKMIKL